jgi:hypothetical protein
MFYYKDEYPTYVAEAAKKLIEARDAYLEAFFKLNETCFYRSIEEEFQILQMIVEIIEKDKKETL